MITPVQLTEEQKLVLDSTADLSPAKLNESLDKRLAFVTSNLALIATVATGFGLFTDIGGPLRENRGGFGLVLVLLLASVVISLIASSPNWFGRVDVNDIDSVRHYFASRYRWRAWAARIAILLFTLAVVVAGATVLSVVDESPAPLVGLRYSQGEKPTVAATVAATALRPGEDVHTELRGCGIDAEVGCPPDAELLASDSTRADSSGKADVALSVSPVPEGLTRFVLVVTAGTFTDTRTVDTE